MHIFWLENTYFLLRGRIATSHQIILLGGGGEYKSDIHRRGGIENVKTLFFNVSSYFIMVGMISM